MKTAAYVCDLVIIISSMQGEQKTVWIRETYVDDKLGSVIQTSTHCSWVEIGHRIAVPRRVHYRSSRSCIVWRKKRKISDCRRRLLLSTALLLRLGLADDKLGGLRYIWHG